MGIPYSHVSNIYYTPSAGTSNSLNVSSGKMTIPLGTQTGIRLLRFSSISVGSGGDLVVAGTLANHNNGSLVVSNTLTLAGTTGAWTGELDMGCNDLDVQSGNLATITNQIAQGFNGGTWNNSGGICSAAAAADSTHLTALGSIKNNQTGSAIFSSSNKFDQFCAPGVGDILVKYTYYGDADLSGAVDGSDYTLIDNGYNNHLTGWLNGDFNYDGTIDGSDYTLIDAAFSGQGSPFST
jgi:hypothetical protein